MSSTPKPHASPTDKTTLARQRLQQTRFLLSAPTFKLCPADTGVEVAFAGRSNAGKSSAINALTNQRQLARSSKTPGRTQMINFFAIDMPIDYMPMDDAPTDDTPTDQQSFAAQTPDSAMQGNAKQNSPTLANTRLVDLPGYGYAAVPEQMKKEWQVELEHYLVSRQSLTGLVLLTDIRHPLKFFDEQMLVWAKDGNLPVHVLLTKADKLKYGAAKNTLLGVRKQLQQLDLPFSIQLFSALKKQGIDELAAVLDDWLLLSSSYTKSKN